MASFDDKKGRLNDKMEIGLNDKDLDWCVQLVGAQDRLNDKDWCVQLVGV